MAGKFLWFALFVTFQVTFVLCRSTGKPNEDNKEFITSLNSEAPKAEALSGTVAPGKMTTDEVPKQMSYTYYHTEVDGTAVIIVVVIYVVFLVISFILGCILYYRSKSRAVRRGYIVNTGTSGIPSSGVPSAGIPSFGVNQGNTVM